jgi:hypothetical protein
MSTAEGKRKATNAAEWADDVSDMLLTYSRRHDDVIAFARSHGVIAGIWVEKAHYGVIDYAPAMIVAERGWTIEYDGERFVVVTA